MKNLNKMWFALCAALTLLAWVGCSNILNPVPQNSDGNGGLRITVENGDQTSRTLIPTIDFVDYVLSFEGPDGATHADVTIDSGNQTTVNGLAAGTWTITAKGYVMIGGNRSEAASGSKQVTVNPSGPTPGVTIDISASQSGANGTFSYKVTWPTDKGVSSANLNILSTDGVYDKDFSLTLTDGWATGSESLSPGYYIVSVQLENENQIAGNMDVIHIYSGAETTATYTFIADDFATFITLGGEIWGSEYAMRGSLISATLGKYVHIYQVYNKGTAEETTDLLGVVTVNIRTFTFAEDESDSVEGQPWSWKTIAFANDTDIRLCYVDQFGIERGRNEATIKDQDKTDFSFTTTTIRITFDANGGSVDEEYRDIHVNRDEFGTLPVPTRNDYTFLGWFNDDGREAAPQWTYPVDLTLLAKWMHKDTIDEPLQFVSLAGAEKTALSNGHFAVYYFELPAGTEWSQFDGISADYQVGERTYLTGSIRNYRLMGPYQLSDFVVPEDNPDIMIAEYLTSGLAKPGDPTGNKNAPYILDNNQAGGYPDGVGAYEWFTVSYSTDGSNKHGSYEVLPATTATGPFIFALGLSSGSPLNPLNAYVKNVRLHAVSGNEGDDVIGKPLYFVDSENKKYPAFAAYDDASSGTGLLAREFVDSNWEPELVSK